MKKRLVKLTLALLCVITMSSAFTVTVLAAPAPAVFENSGTANGNDIFYGAYWKAQTFTPDETHNLTSVELPLIRRGAAAGDVIVSIRETGPGGYPSGPDLASGTVPVSSVTAAWSPAVWYSFDLGSGCLVEQGKTYAVVLRAPEAGPMYYWVDLNGTYSGGRAMSGYNGSSWVNQGNWDAAFRTYGLAVTASEPAPPVISRIGYQTVYRDTWIEFYVEASDPNNDSLTFSASNLPPGATFDKEEGFFEWKRPARPGVFIVIFKVSDGRFIKHAAAVIRVKEFLPDQDFSNLCPDDSYNLIYENSGDEDFVILDIRRQDEFDSGYIQGAVLLDYYAEDFASQLAALDRDKTYFIYCRTGHRTGLALNIMAELGFKDVYNLEEGITAWTDAGYSTVTPENPATTTPLPPPTSGG